MMHVSGDGQAAALRDKEEGCGGLTRDAKEHVQREESLYAVSSSVVAL